MVIEKPKLFLETRDFLLFIFLMLSLISIRLFFSYQQYQAFISKPFYYTTATVLNAYPKTRNGKTYTVLKLQSPEGLTFFTTSYRKQVLKNKILRLQIYPSDRITFWEYLGYFYVKSRIKRIEEIGPSMKERLLEKVSSQHTDPSLASFYQGIFFATPLLPELRKKITALGVSHLVALSGFHLGILWSVIYGLFLLLYRPLQQRYFPYRYSLLDIGAVTIILLGFYVWFVGAPPSLLRSYAMVLVGWVVILLGMELLSFTFLTTIALVLLLLFPTLIVSLSFWLSVCGVFYIFLLLRYASEVNGWIVSLFFIPVGIFLLMQPVVHGIFGLTTSYQLLSPLLSLLFILFYPLVIVLHLLGLGGVLDSGLTWLFLLPSTGVEKLLPLWMVGIYLGLSLWAIWSRWVFWLLLGVAGIYGVSLYL